jgi:hypothetical protein
MKTKRCEFYVDLWAGWQDGSFIPTLNPTPFNDKLPDGYRRVKVVVDLPCFGGSADITETVTGKPEELNQ